MIDLLGSIVVELRTDTAFLAWHGGKVRGGEPAPGDVLGAPYQRFVVVQSFGGLRLSRAPVQFPRFLVTCWGLSPQDAMAGYGYASDALHNVGARLRANGFGIYNSLDESGGQPDFDPRTKQPRVDLIAQIIGTTQVYAA